VIGSDFGADGYTTVEQADELARRLELRPGLRLLDLGCGSGWPGLYLAMRTGCQVVLSDVPLDGLRSAKARAVRERLSARCAVVAASGPHLPFAGKSFDAIVHTDVLCCLRQKLSVLRANWRVLRPGGRIAFYTIIIARGLSTRDHRRAVCCGPPAVGTRSDYLDLLRSAGFVELDEVDVTAAYRDTARAWLRHRQEFEAGLAALEPPGAFAAKLARRRAAIALIDAGHLRRSLLLATRPSRRARREGRLATAAHEIDPGAVTPHR
jgi:SAM-dependent methyltransferase